jgi:D-alanine-D-alanine ligase
MKIGMTFDLRSAYLAEGYTQEQAAEFDADVTIDGIEAAIRELGHAPDRIGHGRSLCRRLAAGDRWDLVFNVAEGVRGRSREAQVPALLEMFGIPCTFSDPLVCAVTLDKAVTKRLVASGGLRTAGFTLVRSKADLAAVKLPYPLFAKPVAEGTGKGVDGRSRVDSPKALRETCLSLLERFAQPVLVEEYLPGREFTTGILGTGAKARVLGTMEVVIKPHAATTDYSYEVKENSEELVEYPELDRDALRDGVEALALASYRLLECRDAGRVDIRMDAAGRPAFIEINPLAGLNPVHSDLPMIATRAGMSYRDLIGAIIESASERVG